MFSLAAPGVLLFIILPLVVNYFFKPTTHYLPAALALPFYNALPAEISQTRSTTNSTPFMRLFFISWVLILLALAGPRWIGNVMPSTQEGRNIMLVLDLSGSMELNDMVINGRPVARLTLVKRAAIEFVRQRVGDRIGLILFGTAAYLQTPLTFDHQSVLMRIRDATVGLAGKTTSIGDALGLAVKRLQNVGKVPGVIILLTDGANNSGILTPLQAAELAKDDTIKVYTIGLGSDVNSSFYNDLMFNAGNGIDLDEKTLQEIANLTGGHYFRATDSDSLYTVYKTIHQLETTSYDKAAARPQIELYPWPLAGAFFLLLYWFGQKAKWTWRDRHLKSRLSKGDL